MSSRFRKPSLQPKPPSTGRRPETVLLFNLDDAFEVQINADSQSLCEQIEQALRAALFEDQGIDLDEGRLFTSEEMQTIRETAEFVEEDFAASEDKIDIRVLLRQEGGSSSESITFGAPASYLENHGLSLWGVPVLRDDGYLKVAVIFGQTPEEAQKRAEAITQALSDYLDQEGA